jgi:hypothetical protein
MEFPSLSTNDQPDMRSSALPRKALAGCWRLLTWMAILRVEDGGHIISDERFICSRPLDPRCMRPSGNRG